MSLHCVVVGVNNSQQRVQRHVPDTTQRRRSCSCRKHITNSVIGVSGPPVLDCGTTFHPDYNSQDLHSTPSDNLRKLIYLATEVLSDSFELIGAIEISLSIYLFHTPNRTSLCSASYVSWQRDTAHISCCTTCCCAPCSCSTRYLLPAGPTAANRPQWHTAVNRWDRQTDKQMDRQTPYCYIDPATYYASSVNAALCVAQYTKVDTHCDKLHGQAHGFDINCCKYCQISSNDNDLV